MVYPRVQHNNTTGASVRKNLIALLPSALRKSNCVFSTKASSAYGYSCVLWDSMVYHIFCIVRFPQSTVRKTARRSPAMPTRQSAFRTCVNQPTSQSINQSINQPVNQPVCRSHIHSQRNASPILMVRQTDPWDTYEASVILVCGSS